jgi:hypothetical protein
VLQETSTIRRTIDFNNRELPIAEALNCSGDHQRDVAGRGGQPPAIR